MKKTRWLAGMLCIMMLMTVIPVVAVASEVTYATIEEITGYDLLTVKTYDFTAENAESLYTGSSSGCDSNEVTFDTTDGMTLSGTAPRWRFGSANSSSLGADRVIYFRAKVAEGGSAMAYFHVPDTTADSDAYEVSITPEGISAGAYSTGTQMAAFVPGTGYVEYLAIDKEDGNGLFLYAKGADQYEGKWVCVLNETVPNGSLSSSSEVYFTGSCSVQEIILYQEYAIYDSMEEIVGLDLLVRKSYDFTTENAESMYTGSSSGCDSNEVSFDTANGMTLSGAAPRWRIGSANSSSLGENRAVYFRLKADAEKETSVYLHVPDTTADQDAYGISISSAAVKAAAYTTGNQVMAFVPGTGFVDYLAMDRQDGKGLLLYARNDDQYGGKWVCVLNETVPNGSLSASSEVYFTTAGSVQEVVLYGAAKTFDDMKTIVGAELYPYKSFHFSAANAESLYSGFDSLDDTYDTTNGLVLADTNLEDAYSPRWRWSKEDSWSAIADGRAVYFKAKLPTTSDVLQCYFKSPNDETEKKEEAYALKITATEVTPQGAATIGTSFAPGTEWAEYLVLQGENGMMMYAKQEGFLNGKWFHLFDITATSAISKNSAVYFAGIASVQDAVIYTPNAEEEELPPIDPGAEIYDSIDGIIGKTVIPYKVFDMSNKNYQSQPGFVFKPSGEHTPENGAPIESTLEGGLGFWRFYNGVENWSPLTPGARGAYFQLKVEEGKSVEVKVQNPNGNNEYGSFTISPTAFGKNNFISLEYAREGGAGTDFVEYFVAAEERGRVKLYAKNLAGDGKWILAAVANGYANKDNASIGLYFAGDGYLKSVKLYDELDESLLYDTMEDIAGEGLFPYKNFNFTSEGAPNNLPIGKYDQAEVTFGTEDGMVLKDVIDEENDPENAIGPRWRFADSDGWSAIDNGRVVYFKAKVPENQTMVSYFKMPNDTTEKQEQVYVLNIAPTGIFSDATAEMKLPFAPGTDWAEYLIAKTETGMAVYARQDGFVGGKWVYVLHVTATSEISKHSAVYFTKCGSIQKLTIYDTNMVFTTKDTLADITGTAYAAQNFVFRPGFDVLLNGGTFPQGEAPVIDENGMKLEEGKNWRFYQNGDGWSPLDHGDTAVFRAKVSDSDDILEVLMKSPLDNQNKAYIIIRETGVVINNNADVDMKFNFVPGTDWVEYLVQANDNGGYDVWVKATLFGNDKWYLLAETTAYNDESGSKATGFRFRCNATCNAYIDYAKVYADDDMVEEAVTKPTAELMPYFEEEFNSTSIIENGVANSMAVENGVLAVTEGAASGEYTIMNGGILKGGYAEFRTAGIGVNKLVFCDGTDCLQLSFNGPAAVVGMEETEQGTRTIDITDGGNIYRIWRIVRNADGSYNGYTKMEDEGVWVKAFENQAPVPVSDAPAQVAILAGNSEVKYDYFRIYGPAPEKELTLQDGFGIAELPVTGGVGSIAYPSAFRAIVREGDAEKTLIIAEVKDGLLTNLVCEKIEVGSDVIPVTYSMKDKTATLKVLLWDGIGSMNHLNEGARLTVAK